MAVVLALVVGCLYGLGIFLILRRSLVRVALGLVALGHAANLLIFSSAGLRRTAPFLTASGARPPGAADPVPQALVLTAIVIGFAVLAFVLALARRAVRELGTDDVDEIEGAA